MISTVISTVMAALILMFHTQLLRLLFGKIEADVMAACESYLWITTLSLPFLAIYDAGAALCRSIGKTNVTMNVSIVANIINVVGNCIGVFALKMGAAGVAWPSLISRVLSAVAVTVYCFRKQNTVRYRLADMFAWDGGLLKKVMGIALPNGVENGVHQLVKVALSSMVALFGTYQIAANGVAQSIWSLASIMGLGDGSGLHHGDWSVHGCAEDIDAANFYFKKLNQNDASAVHCVERAGFLPLLRLSSVTPPFHQKPKHLVIWLVLINNIFNGLAYPFAGSLGNGLRAAGDVKFTMIVSITLTIAARLFFSALFGLWLGWGVIGVASRHEHRPRVPRRNLYPAAEISEVDTVPTDLTENRFLHWGSSMMHPLKSRTAPPLSRSCTPLHGFYQNYGSFFAFLRFSLISNFRSRIKDTSILSKKEP